ERGDVLDQRPRTRLRAAPRVGRDRPERTGDAGFSDAREVDLAVVAGAEEPVAVATPQVVAAYARPDERMDVEVEHLACRAELGGLARDAETRGGARRVERRSVGARFGLLLHAAILRCAIQFGQASKRLAPTASTCREHERRI